MKVRKEVKKMPSRENIDARPVNFSVTNKEDCGGDCGCGGQCDVSFLKGRSVTKFAIRPNRSASPAKPAKV